MGQYCELVEPELGYSWFSGGSTSLLVRSKNKEKGKGYLEDDTIGSNVVIVETQE